MLARHGEIWWRAVCLRSVVWCALAGMAVCHAAAQAIRVNPSSGLRPQLNLGGTIAVSATPSGVTFDLVPSNVAAGSSAITIQTKVTNLGLFNSVSLYGYFANTAALTSNENATISSANVFGYSDAQPTWQPFSGTCPFATGSCLLIFRTTSLLNLGLGAGHQNTLSLQIDLTNAPQQPAGSYSGTLVLQAQAL